MTLHEIIEQVKRLSADERRELTQKLQAMDEVDSHTADLWVEQFQSIIWHDVQVNEEPSIRREDWYDDDGR